MWIDKLVKIKWMGRRDSRVVAIVKLGKSWSLSRVAWKPVRILQSDSLRGSHTIHVTRECGSPKTYSIPLLTTQDASGMLWKPQISFHGFRGLDFLLTEGGTQRTALLHMVYSDCEYALAPERQA